MTNMKIQDAYNAWADTYDSNNNLTRDLDSTMTQRLLTGQQFDSILELGCGTGKNTSFIAQIGKHVHALDFSQEMIQKARTKVKSENVRFETADLTHRWPCEDDAYDLIVCNLVLEHINDLAHIFSEADRTLRSGGRFLVQELHPFRQYNGTKARFEMDAKPVEVEAFVHHISDFLHAAESHRLKLEGFIEYWHETDEGKPPRLVSFMFTRD